MTTPQTRTTPIPRRIADDALVEAVVSYARQHGSVSYRGVAIALGASGNHVRKRLASLVASVADADADAGRFLAATIERSRQRRANVPSSASGGLGGSWDGVRRAISRGEQPPEDFYGSGFPTTEVAGWDCLPGSDARVEMYTRRYERRERLFSSLDLRPGDSD
jgi:hypothetical protein